MPEIDAPMNTAHQHAANADDYRGKGLIVLAAEEHLKAAEAYMAAIQRSHDESAKRTLHMLYKEQTKRSSELQRRIEKLKEEGKDPALPQKPDVPNGPALRQNSNSYLSPPRATASPPPNRNMTDSQQTVDESFMVLGGQRSDPGDAFNQFWNIMQGMLDNLSQPVAFATAPLGHMENDLKITSGSNTPPRDTHGIRRDGSLSSDTDPEEPILSRLTRRIGLSRDGSRLSRLGSSSSASASAAPEDDLDDFIEDGDELSESFFLIPSGSEPSPAALKKENKTLKVEITAMQKRLEATEKVLSMRKEQDMQLRDSIVQATREAQRVMGASAVIQRPGLDFSNVNVNVPAIPIPGFHSGREAQYARRVKELEEEVRALRSENEKHKAMIVKFRERWEKLKDSAKRKKEAKAAAEASTAGVRERIVEEPEAEEELDNANTQ